MVYEYFTYTSNSLFNENLTHQATVLGIREVRLFYHNNHPTEREVKK